MIPEGLAGASGATPGENPGEGWESFEAPEPEDGGVLVIFKFDSVDGAKMSKSVDIAVSYYRLC